MGSILCYNTNSYCYFGTFTFRGIESSSEAGSQKTNIFGGKYADYKTTEGF